MFHAARLLILEEKLPLASYFSDTSERLLSWLQDVQTEVSSVEIKDDETVEQAKSKQDRAKVGVVIVIVILKQTI